jgi:AbrB family looped-hinge helix DNA binding protein
MSKNEMPKEERREVLGVSKLTYKFQITIPKEVRERFQLKEGETIVFIGDGCKVFIIKSKDIYKCGHEKSA